MKLGSLLYVKSDNIIITNCTINTFVIRLIIHCYSFNREINLFIAHHLHVYAIKVPTSGHRPF